MATWKKVVISGSDISQLNNNLEYIENGQDGVILTGSFTGSFDGEFTGILADGTTATTQTTGDNSTKVATTAYVDAVATAADLNITGSGGTTTDIDLDSQSLTFIGQDGLQLSASAQTITATIADGGIANAKLENSTFNVGAGNGLTDGGSADLGSTSTVNIGQGTHITVGANDISVNTTTLTPSISGSILNTISGDVTVDVDGNSTIQPNSVALGTDTTGDYIQNLGTGTGVTINSNTGEGSQPTIAVDYGSDVNTAVEGNTTITINGTNNEIDITGTAAQALGGAPSYTVGLSDTIGGNRTFSDDIIIGGDLTVQGTASFQHTEEYQVADRFILMASGSSTEGDGGIVIQQGTQNEGEVFGFDSGTTRFGLTGSFDASATAFTPDAFMAAVVEGADDIPGNAPARYQAKGNIFVGNTEGEIWIYG